MGKRAGYVVRMFFAGLLWVTLATLGLQPARADAVSQYTAMLNTALVEGPDKVDLLALRAAFAASPVYRGSSGLKDIFTEGLVRGGPDPFAGVEPDKIETAIALDYPLLEMHRIAFAYYKHQTPPDTRKMARHAAWGRALSDAILSHAMVDGKTTTYKVLSVGEEYELLAILKLNPTSQALVMDQGQPFDLFDFGDRVIRFDISAFYGKF